MTLPEEFDVIIAGGGASGCVLAGRLAAASPSTSILLVEAGINNKDHPLVIQPAMYAAHLAPTSTTASFYIGSASEKLAGRNPIVPVANILGGGSSINFMMYTRACKSDYDDWGVEGWTGQDVVPLLRKLETYHLENKDPKIHGFKGPINVSYGGKSYDIAEEILGGARDLGYPIMEDLQDLETGNAWERWGKYIHPNTGRRQDTAHCYVHPQLEKPDPNLHVLCESKVSRVLIENGKAVGIEYVPATKPASDEPTPSPKTIKARKLVVVSAGALGSPQILERSGIGSPSILEKAGLKPEQIVSNLPGVGENYQDHNLIFPMYRLDPSVESQDDFLRGVPEVYAKALEDFASGKGQIATNYIDAGGKVRPNRRELERIGPAFAKVWEKHFENAADKPVLTFAVINAFVGDHAVAPPGPFVTFGCFLNYPQSRGRIHITSTSPHGDTATPPEFDPGFFEEEADVKALVWGYKLGREVARRMPSYRGEVLGVHPKFSPTSNARCQDIDLETSKALAPNADNAVTTGVGLSLTTPAPQVIPTNGLAPGDAHKKGEKIVDLEYSEEDDRAIEQWLRENVATTWHSMGTLAMKPREKGGVVDEKLSVYGVQNLKVADLSVCPANVGANTYSTALVIGEKAAALCAEFLGIDFE